MKEDKRGLLHPETGTDASGEVPGVYRSLNFRSLQEPYHHTDSGVSRYSTLRADNLEVMLNGGLERFYKKYSHLPRKINLQLPTPEVRFENLSFSVQVPAEVGAYGTVGSHLAQIFTPWQKVPMKTKYALHPISGIIKPGSMTLVLANLGAGKSTFLKALAGKLQDNSKTTGPAELSPSMLLPGRLVRGYVRWDTRTPGRLNVRRLTRDQHSAHRSLVVALVAHYPDLLYGLRCTDEL